MGFGGGAQGQLSGFSSPTAGGVLGGAGGGQTLIGVTAMLVSEGGFRGGVVRGGDGGSGFRGDSGGDTIGTRDDDVLVYCGRADGCVAVCSGGGGGGKSTNYNSSILGVLSPPAQWNGSGGGVRLLRLIPRKSSSSSSSFTDPGGGEAHDLFIVYDNGTWARFTRALGRGGTRVSFDSAERSNGHVAGSTNRVAASSSPCPYGGDVGSFGWRLSAAAPGPHPELADIFRLKPR